MMTWRMPDFYIPASIDDVRSANMFNTYFKVNNFGTLLYTEEKQDQKLKIIKCQRPLRTTLYLTLHYNPPKKKKKKKPRHKSGFSNMKVIGRFSVYIYWFLYIEGIFILSTIVGPPGRCLYQPSICLTSSHTSHLVQYIIIPTL